MDDLKPDKFYQCCFRLDESDIRKFDEEDNGPINNVMVGIAHECFGARLFDDSHGLTAEFFYINGYQKLKGDIIQIDLYDEDYFELLMRFCMLLADEYRDMDAIDAFNTFQNKLRGFLEKLGFQSVTSMEIERFEGQDAVMMTAKKRGFFRIPLIEKKDFYRNFFGNCFDCSPELGKEYVYLMVNTDTSLIKIGKSNNPKYRERTLHSQEPAVHLVAAWCCDPKIEKELHAKFAHKHKRGEWFRLSIHDLKQIEEFMNQRLSAKG